MSNYPLYYSKKPLYKKANKNLVSLFDLNFNQLSYPVKCKVEHAESFINRPIIEWPLKSIAGQPLFYGYLNEETNQVEVYDDSIILLLSYLGNYGNCYFLDNLIGNRFHKINNRKQNDKPAQPSFVNDLSNPANLFELNQDTYRHNLHIDSLNKLFKEFGKLDSKKLINQLYSNDCNDMNYLKRHEFQCNKSKDVNQKKVESFRDSELEEEIKTLKKKKLNSFEETFIKMKKSFNQNFIDREEYVLKFDLEEAFFLRHVFGILSVQVFNKSHNESYEKIDKINTTEMQVDEKIKCNMLNLNLINFWLKCIELYKSSNQCFITKYAAYFYFRSKGFIVKNGIKFGSDFVLYNQNPLFVHSTYSIMLIKRFDEIDDQTLKLINIQAFIRMTKCVVKVPILCIVKFPINLTSDELQTPDVIRRLQIKCLLMERWVSSVERDQ